MRRPFHKYLYGREFLIKTDHAALSWLLRLKNRERQVAKLTERLQQYDFKLQYCSGPHHNNADALSISLCKEYKHCKKVHEREGWADKAAVAIKQNKGWTAEIRTAQQGDSDVGPPQYFCIPNCLNIQVYITNIVKKY